mgnify:CR=1 FL=1
MEEAEPVVAEALAERDRQQQQWRGRVCALVLYFGGAEWRVDLG